MSGGAVNQGGETFPGGTIAAAAKETAASGHNGVAEDSQQSQTEELLAVLPKDPAEQPEYSGDDCKSHGIRQQQGISGYHILEENMESGDGGYCYKSTPEGKTGIQFSPVGKVCDPQNDQNRSQHGIESIGFHFPTQEVNCGMVYMDQANTPFPVYRFA